MDGFAELYGEVEVILMESVTASEPESLNHLFRSIHSIKGNAAIMQLFSLVDFTHVIEDVAEALRGGRFPLTEPIGECILLGLDRLRDLHNRELWGHEFGNLYEQELKELFKALAVADSSTCEERAKTILNLLGAGVYSANEEEIKDDKFDPEARPQVLVVPDQGTPERAQADLSYFQELSFFIDQQSPYWIDRSVQLFDWAHKMNLIAGSVVNYEQLTAAIYLHDLGMMFVPHEILNKVTELDDLETESIRHHPTTGCKFLVRIPGWQEAAIMVLEHHEWVNGNGYPNGIKGEAIHPGARILAILDAFFSIVSGRADRTRRRSVIRAISEINAGIGTQFDEYWVHCFNEMIKEESKSGSI